MKPNEITPQIIGAAIEVHREIGPGQDEVLDEDALEVAFRARRLSVRRQCALSVRYKAVKLDCGFRPDFVVEERVVAECKSVERVHAVFQGTKLPHPAELELVVAGQVLVSTLSVPEVLPVHEAQARSQMRLAHLEVALLLNFHAKRLVDGLRRFGASSSSGCSKTPR